MPTFSLGTGQPTMVVKLPALPPPQFAGKVEEFMDNYTRWVRMTGVEKAPDAIKVDWIVQNAVAQHKPLLEKLAKGVSNYDDFISKLKKLFPIETDLTLRRSLQSINPLSAQFTPQEVELVLLKFDEIQRKMTPGAMSDQEKTLALNQKIPIETFQSMMKQRRWKTKMETFDGLAEVLREKALEDARDSEVLQLHREAVQQQSLRQIAVLATTTPKPAAQVPPASDPACNANIAPRWASTKASGRLTKGQKNQNEQNICRKPTRR